MTRDRCRLVSSRGTRERRQKGKQDSVSSIGDCPHLDMPRPGESMADKRADNRCHRRASNLHQVDLLRWSDGHPSPTPANLCRLIFHPMLFIASKMQHREVETERPPEGRVFRTEGPTQVWGKKSRLLDRRRKLEIHLHTWQTTRGKFTKISKNHFSLRSSWKLPTTFRYVTHETEVLSAKQFSLIEKLHARKHWWLYEKNMIN